MIDRPCSIGLSHVSLAFGPVCVIEDVSLSVLHGEFVAIVGPSGCGKTTLLSLLSGHISPQAGFVTRSGRSRMVYQHDGLFPWKTVAENIAMGVHTVGEHEREREVAELIALIGVAGFENHYPHQISGGMRQRVELARALAGSSDFLLMDEPFSSLDYLTRLRMRSELTRLLQQRPRTAVLVTHDIEEAVQLADRVIVLTERPAKIRCELTLTMPRPRGLTDPAIVEAVRDILRELDMESGPAALMSID